MNRESYKDKVFKGIGWTALDRWGNSLFSFVVIALLTRLLDAQAFGTLAAALIFINYLELFVAQGIGFAIVQRKEVTNEHLNAAFWFNTVSGATLSILLWFIAPLIADLFDMKELTGVLKSLSPLLIISGLSRIQAAILTKELKFKELAIRNLCGQVSGSVVGVFLAFQGYGVWSLVWQVAGRSLVGNAVLWFTCRWRPGLSMNLRHAKDLYAYAIKILADQQVLYFSTRLDEGIIGYFLDSASLGYYSVGKRLVIFFYDLFNSTIGTVVFPIFAKVQGDRERLINSFTIGAIFYLAVTIPVFGGLSVFSRESIMFVFGEQWINAAPVTGLLALSGPFQFAPVFIHSIFQATGGPGVSLFLNCLRAVFSFVLFPIGGIFGVAGVAAAFTAKGILAAVVDLTVFKVKFKIKFSQLFWQTNILFVVTICALLFAKFANYLLIQIVDWKIAFVITATASALFYIMAVAALNSHLIQEIKSVFHRDRT